MTFGPKWDVIEGSENGLALQQGDFHIQLRQHDWLRPVTPMADATVGLQFKE